MGQCNLIAYALLRMTIHFTVPNDCPFEIAEKALTEVKKKHKKIDFALVGYTSASLYPHCMMHYDDAEMEIGSSGHD